MAASRPQGGTGLQVSHFLLTPAPRYAIIVLCERGGIGIHKGLKNPRPVGLAGSSPAARTRRISGSKQ